MEGDMILFNVVLMHWLRCGKAFYLERERNKEFIQHNIHLFFEPFDCIPTDCFILSKAVVSF